MTAPRGLLLVVSSPSGAGKTTLCRRLIREHPELRFSVSYTTRPPRPGEVPGADYHFVDEETFSRMAASGAFAEWAHVHGHRYGTAIATVRQALEAGGQVLFDVDYQGAERLKEQFPEAATLVFILPPSLSALQERLRRRGTEPAEVIQQRLRNARQELCHHASYHYLIVNDDIDRAYGELEAVYLVARGDAPVQMAERARACSLAARGPLVEILLKEGERPHGTDPL